MLEINFHFSEGKALIFSGGWESNHNLQFFVWEPHVKDGWRRLAAVDRCICWFVRLIHRFRSDTSW